MGRRIGIWAAVIGAVLIHGAAEAQLKSDVPGTRLQAIGEDLPKGESRSRRMISLSGAWSLTAVPGTRSAELATTDPLRPLFALPAPTTSSAVTVQVPGVWQTQGLGMDYHGVAVYRRRFGAPELRDGQRAWLHLENAAGRAEVRLNGKVLGSHVGAWTPFELDLTDHLGADNELEVKVDEAPEHFTSGFIKHVAPSFGGLWGDVWIEVRSASFVEDLFVVPDTEKGIAQARISLRCPAALSSGTTIQASVRSAGEDETSHTVTASVGDLDASASLCLDVPVENARLWSPESPHLYEMEVRLVGADGTLVDEQSVRFGMRDFRAEGGRLLLNGSPVYWAGILHWGIYPEYLAPACTKEEFRAEMRRLKACGFNGISVCLFMFPERFYQVADEEGMLLWQEYPLWLNYDGARRPASMEDKVALVAEYAEMYRRDRRHPSVVLRSLTVEDPAADRELMRALYDQCHEMIPGSVVQDNSAYLNQDFADFLDMHPYEELPGYRERMAGWMETVRARGGKPLLFGEGLDFDTFRDVPAIAESFAGNRPWWTEERYCRSLISPASSGDFWGHEARIGQLVEEHGRDAVAAITRNSYEHARAARKYQTEQSRLHAGFAGQSLTAIRDISCTRPGIFDDLGRLKWSEKELRRLNAQTLPLISTDRQSRCYSSGETMTVELHLSHFGAREIGGGALRCRLLRDGKVVARHQTESLKASSGEVTTVGKWALRLPRVDSPATLQLVVELEGGPDNSWPVWIFPRLKPASACAPVIHDPAGTLKALDLNRFSTGPDVMVASALDTVVEDHLRGGGNVLLLDPEGKAFPSHDTAFWREVAVERASRDLFTGFPWSGAVDLQFFNIGAGKAYEAMSGPATRSLFRTINCRHLQQNDLVVEKRYGNGLLVATVLNFGGEDNRAGEFLLGRLLHHLVIHTSR